MEIKLNLADGLVVFSALLLAGTSLFLFSRLDFGQSGPKNEKNSKMNKNASNQSQNKKRSILLIKERSNL